jgi:hypothetical protein
MGWDVRTRHWHRDFLWLLIFELHSLRRSCKLFLKHTFCSAFLRKLLRDRPVTISISSADSFWISISQDLIDWDQNRSENKLISTHVNRWFIKLWVSLFRFSWSRLIIVTRSTLTSNKFSSNLFSNFQNHLIKDNFFYTWNYG